MSIRSVRRVIRLAQPDPRRIASAAALQLLGRSLALSLPFLFGQVFHRAILSGAAEPESDALTFFLLLAALASIGASALEFARGQVVERLVADMVRRLKTSTFLRLVQSGRSLLSRYSPGALVSRLVIDAEEIPRLLQKAASAWIVRPAMAAVLVALLLLLNPLAGGVAVLPLLLGTWILRARRDRAPTDEDERHRAWAAEKVSALRILQVYHQLPEESERFESSEDLRAEAHRRHQRRRSLRVLLVAVLGAATLALALWMGARQVLRGEWETGALVTFAGYLLMLGGVLSSLVQAESTASLLGAACARLLEIHDAAPDVIDPPHGKRLESGPASLDAIDARFGYAPGNEFLKGVNLQARAGDRIGLCGATGSGKTTFACLLARLYDVVGGRILLRGQDVREVRLSEVRSRVALVLREDVLFSGTLLENLRYGRPGAPRGELERVARRCRCGDFVDRLPLGFDTPANGAALSDGERQRLFIARAVLRRPELLVLDEATAHLDPETELDLLQAVSDELADSILLVISHRESALAFCDRVFELVDGRFQVRERPVVSS
jgi:ABC-type multidrug transport system fused ATPase/permease subunit